MRLRPCAVFVKLPLFKSEERTLIANPLSTFNESKVSPRLQAELKSLKFKYLRNPLCVAIRNGNSIIADCRSDSAKFRGGRFQRHLRPLDCRHSHPHKHALPESDVSPDLFRGFLWLGIVPGRIFVDFTVYLEMVVTRISLPWTM